MESSRQRPIIETHRLYSDECLLLLKKALEQMQNMASQHFNLPSQSRFVVEASSDEEEITNEHKYDAYEDSSSSEDVEPDHLGEPTPRTTANDLHAVVASGPLSGQNKDTKTATTSTTRNDRPKSMKKTKAELDHKQKELLIRKHTESVIRLEFPVPGPEHNVIGIPSSLLSKSDLQEAEMSWQCRAYVKLSSELGGQHQKCIVILSLRSGRFAGAIFRGPDCVAHRTLQRYTVRKGQGKAQSAQDSKGRPKSMGAQLRRAGEQGLQEDVTATILSWKAYFEHAAVILLACPKVMRKTFFVGTEDVFTAEDARIRRVPLDLGRPTFESVCLIYEVMMTVTIRERQEEQALTEETQRPELIAIAEGDEVVNIIEPEDEPKKSYFQLTSLHVAAKNGDVEVIRDILESEEGSDLIDQLAGEDFMTPLHYAASSSSTVDASLAAECVLELLEQGRANPCIVDARNRPPYFLATHEKVRDAFRMARASLGEEFCLWDESAKVGPALTDDDLQSRREKEALKKRRKKAKQKEKKAKEKAQADELERARLEQEQRLKEQEEAKRIRDGLQPKTNSASNVCDFCQKVCKGKRRSQMLLRLEYAYCSTECVQNHKRELMAAAALARQRS